MATISSATGGAALWGYCFVHGQVITLPYLVAATTSLVQFMFMFIVHLPPFRHFASPGVFSQPKVPFWSGFG